MRSNARNFRNALGCFPTGIVVVTAGAPGAVRAITVNSFSSLSLDPPLILWCIAKSSRRYEAFTKLDKFTVSVLAEGQRATSECIATAKEGEALDVTLEALPEHPPAIDGALAVFACSLEALQDGGDHAIVIGRVEDFFYREDGAPLTFFRGQYGIETA